MRNHKMVTIENYPVCLHILKAINHLKRGHSMLSILANSRSCHKGTFLLETNLKHHAQSLKTPISVALRKLTDSQTEVK